MQNFAAGLIWIALLALPDLASAKTDGPPSFDVARSCKEAQAYANDQNLAYRSCMKDENEARAKLAQKWAHFKPGDRKDCVAQGAAPVPSYVEVLTCLEMSDEAEALYKPDGTRRDKPRRDKRRRDKHRRDNRRRDERLRGQHQHQRGHRDMRTHHLKS